MTTKKTKHAGSSVGGSRIERYYTKIVIAFVIIAVALIGLIVYFSFTTTTITIVPTIKEAEITIETTLNELGGTLVLTDVSGSHDYTGIKGTTSKVGKASGTVTLTNNYTTNQPLVASTRLLSDTGVLFRTQETVTVPAGGQVDVAVAADQEGADGNIGPSHFEIVALWQGLKDKIYGESTAPMIGGLTTIGIASDTDIANAVAEATTILLAEGVKNIVSDMPNRAELDPYTILKETEGVVLETKNSTVSATAGDEVENITVTQELTVAIPVINAETVAALIGTRVVEELPNGMTLADDRISLNDISIAVNTIADDVIDGQQDATVLLKVPVQQHISATHQLLQPKELTNKTEQEIRSYFGGVSEVQNVDISFAPFWLKRTPAVPGNITVIVK